MTRVRLGAVSYLNARPCVVGLDRHPRFDLRFDVPSRCAALLHEGAIDLGLIPSIEYLRGPGGPGGYLVVPDVAIASSGPVASVAVYTKKPIAHVRTLALDTSSRTSVALARVMCARAWSINPALEPLGPDLAVMLERADAALLIGDVALLTGPTAVRLEPDTTATTATVRLKADPTYGHENTTVRLKLDPTYPIEKIDLGEAWTNLTGLPFVYAFWAGRPDALDAQDVRALQEARDAGVTDPDRVARDYFVDPALQGIGARYLRDNIKYHLGEQEQAGLTTFYRYAAELDLVPATTGVRFY